MTCRPPLARLVMRTALVLSCAAPTAVTAVTGAQDAPAVEGPLIIDHRAVAEFDRLSAADLLDAARLKFLFRSASLGQNMNQALNCLMNNFPGRPRRPYACDRGIPANDVVYGSRYNRRNWAIEFRGNPGWYGKISDFEKRIDSMPGQAFDVVAFNFNYGDGLPGSEIVDRFFKDAPDERFGNVATLEALEARHPDLTFVWWSMALPRQSSSVMKDFNQRIREYARTHNKTLFDLADIESHGPDDVPCTDNKGGGLPAICPQYTDERNAGHLNAYGGQRAAKAIWVLLSRLAARTR